MARNVAIVRRAHLRPRGFRLLWVSRPLRYTMTLAVLCLLVGGGVWLYQSPLLRINWITVQGAYKLIPAAVAAASGLQDQSILTADTEAALATIRALPKVKGARLEPKPPQEVIITVDERRPWALWQIGDVRYVIDQDGAVLDEPPPQEFLPLIMDKGNQPLAPGEQVDAEAVRLAQRLIRILPKEMGTKSVAFEYIKGGGLVAVIDGGWRARFGDGTDLAQKIAAWKAVLEQAPPAGIEPRHIDLRFGNRPFVRQ